MSVKTRVVFSSAGPAYQARDPSLIPQTHMCVCAHTHTHRIHTHRKKTKMAKTTTIKMKWKEEGVSVAFWNKACTKCGGTPL